MARFLLGCALAVLAAPGPCAEFRNAGTLVSARSFHTATLLEDGRVLIAGGEGPAGGALSSAEIFDPAEARFSPLPDLPVARRGHAAVRLQDGRVLIAGGDWGQSGDGSAFLFDPRTVRFEVAGKLATPQVGTSAALLPDGRVLLVGGQRPFEHGEVKAAPAEIYDPVAGRFARSPVPPADASLYPGAGGPLWPTATRLLDGRVLLVGSVTAEWFDPATGEFVPAGTTRDPVLRFGSFWHTSTLLADGSVLVTGGHDEFQFSAHAQRFDPASGAFALAGAMRVPRALHTATRLRDGSVLVAGGETWVTATSGMGWFGGSLGSTERYDPVSGQFRPDAEMRAARVGHTATLLKDGRVLIAGGTDFPAYPAAASRAVAGTAEIYGDAVACSKPVGGARCGAK